MASLDNVMQRLEAQSKTLHEYSLGIQPVAGDERALMAQSLALVSEALLRIGRDVRHLRLQNVDKA